MYLHEEEKCLCRYQFLRFIRGISNEPEQQLLISLSYGELLALFERRTELCPGSMK